MDGGNRLVRVFLLDEHGNFNLACRDHLNVHVRLKQRLEHIGSNARVRFHARADNGNLCHVVVKHNAARADGLYVRLHELDGCVHLVLFHGEADVLRAVSADGLQNNIDVYVLLCKLRENAERNSGDVFVLCNTADEHFFHVGSLLNDRSLSPCQAGKNL